VLPVITDNGEAQWSQLFACLRALAKKNGDRKNVAKVKAHLRDLWESVSFSVPMIVVFDEKQEKSNG